MRWIVRDTYGHVFEMDLWENMDEAQAAVEAAATGDHKFIVVRGVMHTGPEKMLNGDTLFTFAPGTSFTPKA